MSDFILKKQTFYFHELRFVINDIYVTIILPSFRHVRRSAIDKRRFSGYLSDHECKLSVISQRGEGYYLRCTCMTFIPTHSCGKDVVLGKKVMVTVHHKMYSHLFRVLYSGHLLVVILIKSHKQVRY